MTSERVKRLKSRQDEAAEGHVLLTRCFSSLTLEKLSKPEHASKICHFTERAISLHMGRKLTLRMITLLDQPFRALQVDSGDDLFAVGPDDKFNDEHARESLGEYGFHHITGIPGTGKTTSLRAAVVYLYGKYASARASVDEDRSLASRRIMLLDGAELATDPVWELGIATMQAYSDTPDVRGQIEELTEMDQLVQFLRRRVMKYSDSITVVVHDGNKLSRTHEAVGKLRTLSQTCRVVFCASASSEWLQVIRHPKTKFWELVVTGLEGAELSSYLAGLRGGGDHIDTKATGTIPRLLNQYAAADGSFERSMDGFRREIGAFMSKVCMNEELRLALIGSREVSALTEFLETKSFYQNPETKRLQCVTEELRGYSLMLLVEQIARRDEDARWEEVRLWMDPILGDDNMVRIGWNTEMATILAMKFFASNVYYDMDKCVPWKVRHVRRFTGEMCRDKLSKRVNEGEGTLHLPVKCSHRGLDAYYEDAEHLVCVQISVARNAEVHHRNTVPTAEKLFRGDDRVKILLWLVYTDRWCSYFVEGAAAARDYYYVTMPFINMCEKLGPIDDRLKALRGRPRVELCGSCHQASGDTSWIQCDFCDSYYHERCVRSWPRQQCGSLRRRGVRCALEGTGGVPDPLLETASPPFECLSCSGMIKRG